MEKKYQEMMAQRKKDEEEWIREMEKHPRCGLLPSPEELDIGFNRPGKDDTDTRKDFDLVHQWLKKIKALNEGFYIYYKKNDGEFLQKTEYGALINLAFSNSFAAMRHTFSPELPEYVIWYYTGHGFDPKCDSSGKSSIPNLEAVGFNTEYNKTADEFAKELQDVPVKGGELCLHHVGYCGLYGLLRPWLAAVKSQSMNIPGEKKNKHLIIILDSCYSGIIAQDLEELNKKDGPWNQNGCTVTIQAACGADQPTYGGYFTPSFLTLNQDQSLLEELKGKWKELNENLKICYRTLPQPSPKVVTTRISDEEQNSPLTVEFPVNDHQITLFPDPGFFKYCWLTLFKHEEKKLLKTRVLNDSTTQSFMNTPNFTVLDYKLKTSQNGPFAGHPMGLFLMEDLNDSELAVCAHVHFASDDTSNVGMINVVHHKVPPLQNVLYVEDHDGLSQSQLRRNRHKIDYAAIPKIPNPQSPRDWEYWSWNTANPSSSIAIPSHIADPSALGCEMDNGARMVKKCHEFVESNESGRWANISRWNMTSNDLSYSGKFRQKERSEWMEKYLEKH